MIGGRIYSPRAAWIRLAPGLSGYLFLGDRSTEECPAPSSRAQMTESPPGRADAAAAGALLLGAMIACAAAGFGLGSLVDLAVPAGLVGLFAGLVVGFALVYARYRGI
jgi:hypothetical protein